MSDGQTPQQVDGQELEANTQDQPKTFDADYVKELRQESAKYRTRAKELEQLLQKQEAERQKAEKAKLEKQGEFETLYKENSEKLQLATTTIQEYEAKLSAQTEALEAIYEQQSASVADHIKMLLADKPVQDRLKWLAENQDKLNTQKANGTPQRGIVRPRNEVKPQQRGRTIRF